MFDAEHREMAGRLIESAAEALCAEELLNIVKNEFSEAPLSTIARAAFLAVTRSCVDEKAIPKIYKVALMLRRHQIGFEAIENGSSLKRQRSKNKRKRRLAALLLARLDSG